MTTKQKAFVVLETYKWSYFSIRLVSDGWRLWFEYVNNNLPCSQWEEDQMFETLSDEILGDLIPVFTLRGWIRSG